MSDLWRCLGSMAVSELRSCTIAVNTGWHRVEQCKSSFHRLLPDASAGPHVLNIRITRLSPSRKRLFTLYPNVLNLGALDLWGIISNQVRLLAVIMGAPLQVAI